MIELNRLMDMIDSLCKKEYLKPKEPKLNQELENLLKEIKEQTIKVKLKIEKLDRYEEVINLLLKLQKLLSELDRNR